MKASILLGSLFMATMCVAQPLRGDGAADKPIKGMPTVLKNEPRTAKDLAVLVEIAHTAPTASHSSFREAALARISNPDPQAGRALAKNYEKLLDDDDQDVRNMAAIACGAIDDKEAIPKLREILKSIPKHRFIPSRGLDYSEYRAAMGPASALAALGDQGSVSEILARETLAPSWEMLLPKFGAQSLPEVVERARSMREGVRNGALKALASYHDGESVPLLERLLTDKDHDIRTAAVRALVGAKSSGAIAAVKRAYPNLDAEGKSTVAVACLTDCDADTATRFVKDVMKNGRQGWSRLTVVMAIGRSGRKDFVPYLESLLADPDGSVREQAACQLAGITGKRYRYRETGLRRRPESCGNSRSPWMRS